MPPVSLLCLHARAPDALRIPQHTYAFGPGTDHDGGLAVHTAIDISPSNCIRTDRGEPHLRTRSKKLMGLPFGLFPPARFILIL